MADLGSCQRVSIQEQVRSYEWDRRLAGWERGDRRMEINVDPSLLSRDLGA